MIFTIRSRRFSGKGIEVDIRESNVCLAAAAFFLIMGVVILNPLALPVFSILAAVCVLRGIYSRREQN